MKTLSDGGKTQFRIWIAGKTIEARFTDSDVADMFRRFISVPEVEEEIIPDAVFCYWRDDCTLYAPPGSSGKTGVWLLRRDTGFIRLVLPYGELTAVDRTGGHYYYCLDPEAEIEPVLYSHPMPELFGIWAMDNSMLMLHSACVGVNGKGILLAARGGGGKSTLAVSCLIGGLDFAGDDYILVNREGPLKAMPLYRTVALNPDMWKKLKPDMPVLRIDESRGGKLLLDASDHPFREELSVQAIIYPVIAGVEEPEVVPADPGPILAKLIHSTAQQLSFSRDPEPYRIMSQRLKGIPAFEIRLSTDLDKNREVLKEFISKEL